MSNKTITYINSSAKKAVKELPENIAIDFLNDLNFVAAGKEPRSDFKYLKSIGPGVIELIENGKPAYRLMYCAKYNDTIYVLHAFTKTTNGVDKAAIDTVTKRYKLMMDEVREAEKAAKKATQGK